MNAWWERLSGRERILIGGSALLVALILANLLIWEPLRLRHRQLQHSVAEQRADLAWMRQAAQEIQRLSGAAQPKREERSLLTLVDQTARAAGLGNALKQIAPQGDAQLSARLDRVAFDQLLPWLGGLERDSGVMLINLSVERTETAGLVNARLIVQGSRP